MKQHPRRCLHLVPVLLGLGLASCQSPLTSPADIAQLAKGGGKGKPSGSGDVILREYWIYPGSAPGKNMIHVAGTGRVDEVNPAVAFDFFFNGIRDDNPPSDQHFELRRSGPDPVPTEKLSSGMWHADIPWNGVRTTDGVEYQNMLMTDVDGSGSDPFTFTLTYTANGKSVGGDEPQGVVDGGDVKGPGLVDVETEEHGAQTGVTSYATFKGGAPEDTFFIQAITLGTVACEVVLQKTGRGKKATTQLVRRVSADYDLLFGGLVPPTGDLVSVLWVEMHFRDSENGALSKREVIITTGTTFSGTLAADFPGTEPMELDFVVDYVIPRGPFVAWGYDPGLNGNIGFSTTAGFGGGAWSTAGPSTMVNDGHFPVAATSAGSVCQ